MPKIIYATSPNPLPSIFNPFYQAFLTTTKEYLAVPNPLITPTEYVNGALETIASNTPQTQPTPEEHVLQIADGTEPLTKPAFPATAPSVGKAMAQERLNQLLEAVSRLPASEQAEFNYCRDRLHYLTAKYQSSAKLAIMAHALLTSIE